MRIQKLLKFAFIANHKLKFVAFLGMTISFVVLLFGMNYYQTETSFDTFHAKTNQLYRLTLNSETGLENALVRDIQRDDCLANIPGIEDIICIYPLSTPVFICKDKIYSNKSVFSVDSSFFKSFSFNLKFGTYKSIFEKPKSIVLTSEFATQIFGHDQVVGETLKLTTSDVSIAELYTVSGIINNFPENSHLTTNALISGPIQGFGYIYFLLHKNTDPVLVEQKLDELYRKPNIACLQPIKDIHLFSNKDNEIRNNGSISSLRIVVISCLLLFIIALCNYIIINWIINIKNVKSIKLKRIVGAKFSSLISDEIAVQLITILSIMVLGTIIYCNIRHCLLFINTDFTYNFMIISLVFIVIAVGAASIPFIRLYHKIRQNYQINQSHYTTLKVLTVFQITIAVGLIIASISVWYQMNFIYQNQLGGIETNLLVLKDMKWDEMKICEPLKQELLKCSGVIGVTTAEETPGNRIKGSRAFKNRENETVNLNVLEAGHSFAEFFNIPLIAGSYLPEYNYSKDWEESHFDPNRAKGPSNGTDYFLVNRKALKVLGFSNPEDAIGMNQESDLFKEGKIIGVVEDFHFGSIYEKDVPLLIKQRNWRPSTFIVRYYKSQEQEVINLLKQQWDLLRPGFRPDYTFMTDIYNYKYRNEKQTFHLILLISALCILLSILGLIGIIAYITNERTKEIGIRRINGAKVTEILMMLHSDFIKWFALSFIVAFPLAYYSMHQWLQNFAYKINLNWWIFALSGLIGLAITLITISWQSWKAAIRNPVEALRYE